jgi:hypothetical protein
MRDEQPTASVPSPDGEGYATVAAVLGDAVEQEERA